MYVSNILGPFSVSFANKSWKVFITYKHKYINFNDVCNYVQHKINIIAFFKLTSAMASKLPKKTLNLKQFLLRQEVLKLYRDVFRTIKKVPDEKTRLELKEWARADFRNNRNHSDETTIKSMLHYGRKSLDDLRKSLALSDS